MINRGVKPPKFFQKTTTGDFVGGRGKVLHSCSKTPVPESNEAEKEEPCAMERRRSRRREKGDRRKKKRGSTTSKDMGDFMKENAPQRGGAR